MTFGSLFSGIGGLDLGLERSGMECCWQVEIDPFCTKVLEKHWPGVKRYGDIKTVTGRELADVDLICGGFPCQDLSQAGKRAGIEGTRSGLWFEFARILGVVRPRYVVIENVPGLLDRRAMPRVIGELARLGYVGCWRCFRASEFGASHLRKRVFIVAYRSSEGRWQDSGSTLGDEAENGGTRRNGRESDGDNFTCGEGSEMADAARGGRRELRQPSELAGRQPDGSNEALDYSASARFDTGQPGQSEQIWDGARRPKPNDGRCDALADSARNEQHGLSGESGWMRRRGVCEAGKSMADTSDGFISQPRRGSKGRDGN